MNILHVYFFTACIALVFWIILLLFRCTPANNIITLRRCWFYVNFMLLSVTVLLLLLLLLFIIITCNSMILCCRYTMTKSTSVIFILMFALLFGLEQWVGSNRSYCIMSKKLIALFKVISYDRILVFKDPSVLWGEDYIISSTQHYFFFLKESHFLHDKPPPTMPPPPAPCNKNNQPIPQIRWMWHRAL